MALLDELFGVLDSIAKGGQTPWAMEASRRLAAGEQLSGADEAVAEQRRPAAVAPPPIIPALPVPAGGGSPVPAPNPAPAPAPAPAPNAGPARPQFGNSLLDGIGGAIASRLGIDTKHDPNLAYDLLTKRGMNPQMAEAAARDPKLFRSMIPALVSAKANALDIVEVPGAYGQSSKYVRHSTGEFEPMQSYVGRMSRTPNGGQAPAAPMPMPSSPAPVMADAPAAPAAAPAPAPAPSVGLPLTTPIGKMPTDGDYVIGAAVPKPPEGYVHKLAENGQGYLYSRDGRPVFESKAEVDARGKNAEKRMEATDKQNKAAAQLAGGLNELAQLPGNFNQGDFERAIGPWAATSPDSGTWGSTVGAVLNYIPQQAARAAGELDAAINGGTAPTEVRDRIEAKLKNIAAVMKPLIRAPGEGAWSDKDQANLEGQLGNLARARSLDEYNRRLGDIKNSMEQIFGMPMKGVNIPEQAPPVMSRSQAKQAQADAEADIARLEQMKRERGTSAYRVIGVR